MKLKLELLAITAASVLTVSTAFASGITEGSSAQPGASESVTDNESPTATGTPPMEENEQAAGETPTEESVSQAEAEEALDSETSAQAEPAPLPEESAQAQSEPMPQDQPAAGAGMAGGASQQVDSETVKELQQALNDKGFNSGQADGIIGPKTQEALRNFQEEQGMQASGQPDQETLAALGVESQQASASQSESWQSSQAPESPSDRPVE